MHQTLRSEEEKRGLCKGKGSVGRTDKGETALHHEKTSRKPIKCFGCGEENHVIKSCPKRKKGQHEQQNKLGNSLKHKATRANADEKKGRGLLG